MSTAAFLARLRKLDIRVWNEGSRLRYSAPEGVMTPALREELAARKHEILDLLSSVSAGQRAVPSIPRYDRDGTAPLSFAQQQMWLVDSLAVAQPLGAAAYSVPIAFRLLGTLRVDVFARCLNEIVRRHEALRTIVGFADGMPVQVIQPASEVGLSLVDLHSEGTRLPEAERAVQMRELARHAVEQPFDLQNGPLLRVTLVRLAEHEHVVFWTMHHLICDGWSVGVLIREIGALYAAFSSGQAHPEGTRLPELACQYADYAIWQRELLARAEVRDRLLGYWRQHLAGMQPLALPTDRPRPARQSFQGAQRRFKLSSALRERLVALGRDEGATLFMTLLAGFQAVLARYTGQNDIVVGTPVANRNSEAIEGLIGFFTNMLVLRLDLHGVPCPEGARPGTRNPTFRELLRRVRDVTVASFAHQDLPFEQLVEAIQPERDPSRNPLFQVLFALQNAPIGELRLPGLVLEQFDLDITTTRFDLECYFWPVADGLEGSLIYNVDLFEPDTIDRFAEHFQTLLQAVGSDPERRLMALPLMSEQERRQVVYSWNDTASAAPPLALLHHVFERQVALTPEATAVIFGEHQVSYQALNQRADRLAAYLTSLGVGPDVPVGICVERSLDLPIAVLSVLKAGGAYVPLDPAYPAHRLALMLQDSQASIVLTQRHLLNRLPDHAARVVCLDDDLPAAMVTRSMPVSPQNLAYVLYTSGSTGRPKAVAMPHAPLVNLIDWQQRNSVLGFGSRTLQFTSLSFDVACQELFATWSQGGTLVMVPEAVRADPEALLALIEQERIERLFLPFVALDQLAEVALHRVMIPTSLREIVTAGEQLRITPAIRNLLDQRDTCLLYNQYGPAEAHVVTSLRLDRDQLHDAGLPPIGRPIANTQIYILDRAFQPVPPRVVGELYIGGAAPARGYFGRPAETAAAFLPDPFGHAGPGTQSGGRLYRTGDLARWRVDGQIEFLGRADNQVKIRGYRVEVAEVEAALEQAPGVREAVVVQQGDAGQTRLVGVVVPSTPATFDPLAVRRYLSERIPSYMIPAAVAVLDRFPLTPSGKVDRRALAGMSLDKTESSRGYVAPRNPIEELLAQIWAEVIQLPRVGRDDNFFELGGHSLLATQLILRLNETFGVELPLATLAEAPTIEALAVRIEQARAAAAGDSGPSTGLTPLVPDQARLYEPFPLNDIQQAYWIGRSEWFDLGNVATHIYFEVEVEALDLDRLERSWQRVVARHPMLRAVVRPDGQQQILAEVLPYTIAVRDLRAAEPLDRDAELETIRQAMSHQVLDSATWPLFDLRASRLGAQHYRLHVSLDALVTDARSLQIVGDELTAFYQDPAYTPAPLEVSFRDYVLAEAALRDSAAFRAAEQYWFERIDHLPPAPELSQVRHTDVESRFTRREHTLSADTWQTLIRHATRYGLTPSCAVLAAFAEVLTTWSRSPHFTLNLTFLNRLPLHPQIDQVVGDFTSLVLLEVNNAADAPFAQRARAIQDQLWRDLDHRTVSGVHVMRELRRRRGSHRAASMPVVFTSALALRGEQPTADLPQSQVVYSITQTPQVWLDHQIYEDADTLVLNWDAVEELFPDGMLDDMFIAYRNLLERLAAEEEVWQAQQPVPLLAAHQQVQAASNATDAPYAESCLHELFDQARRRDPRQTAVIDGSRHLSYDEIGRRAAALGKRLQALDVQPGSLVGVLMEKGWEQVVAVLGIHSAAAAYLPISADLPPLRRKHLIERGQVKVLVTQPWLRSLCVSEVDADHIVVVDDELIGESSALRVRQRPTDLAYVIFTSGSTGAPKGVMIDHRGAVNTILDINRRFEVTPSDRVLALSSLSFDLSVYDIFGTLAAGATVVLPGHGMARDPAHWAELVSEHGITIWNSVPALMQMLVEHRRSSRPLPSLRLIMLSGDWIPTTLPNAIQALAPEGRVISLGGATEASIWSILYPIDRVDPQWTSIPYGKPMANQHFYVLDHARRSRPIWVPGDLYIGGIGVACGYWRDEDRTRASFVTHPTSGERLYLTGDVGRYLPDGNIEFLGREDAQVKIWGHRIELEEIEAALLGYAGVQAAVAAVQRDQADEPRLVAYIVSAGADLTAADLRGFLQARLPTYMVPSSYLFLEALPLSSNGKVDRAALPVAALETAAPEAAALPAESSAVVARLTEIVSSTLQRESIAPDMNLLDLGANSVDLIRIVNRIEQELGFRPGIEQLYSTPTIAAIAAAFVASESGQLPSLPAHERRWQNQDRRIMLDPDARAAFKQQKRGLRAQVSDQPFVALPSTQPIEELREQFGRRRSERRFSPQPIDFDQFSRFISCLRQLDLNGEAKALYPSAGGLYPIRIYLHVQPGRISDLAAGSYYYHPERHGLELLVPDAILPGEIHDPFINRPIFEQAAFSIFLIGKMDAIAPLYGDLSRDFCLLEAGYIGQLLMMNAPSYQIGLCPIGTLDFERAAPLLSLESDCIYIHSLLGGLVSEQPEPGSAARNADEWEILEL